MKIDFVKNTKRIIISNLASTAIKTLIPFFRKTVFMWVLGSEYLGLNGLFYSILGTLMFAELGFGSAIVSYMYKPVAEDNHTMLCAYLRFYRNVYRCVGAFIFAAGLCLLPFLRHIIHGYVPTDVNLHLLYLMFLTNTAIGYAFFAYRGSLFAAHHRNDILNYIGLFTSIVEVAAGCIVLFITHNYYFYVIVLIASTLLGNILVFLATKMYYPNVVPDGNLPKEEVKRILGNVKALCMHKFGGVINGSFDNVVISAFIGLSSVAAFNNYSHINSAVIGITGGLTYSMIGGFGNKIYTESREENYQLLIKVNRVIICLIIWGAAMLLALFQPFMTVWTRKDPTLIRHFLTAFLMVVWFYEKQSRETLRMFKNAAALWQPDRWKAVIAAIANLALNITFVKTFPDEYKLDGVILSTVITDVVIEMPWESYAVFSAFFTKNEALGYWKQQSLYFPIAVLVCCLTWFAAYSIPQEGLQGLASKGTVAFLVSATLLTIFFRNITALLIKNIYRDVKTAIQKVLHR